MMWFQQLLIVYCCTVKFTKFSEVHLFLVAIQAFKRIIFITTVVSSFYSFNALPYVVVLYVVVLGDIYGILYYTAQGKKVDMNNCGVTSKLVGFWRFTI